MYVNRLEWAALSDESFEELVTLKSFVSKPKQQQDEPVCTTMPIINDCAKRAFSLVDPRSFASFAYISLRRITPDLGHRIPYFL